MVFAVERSCPTAARPSSSTLCHSAGLFEGLREGSCYGAVVLIGFESAYIMDLGTGGAPPISSYSLDGTDKRRSHVQPGMAKNLGSGWH